MLILHRRLTVVVHPSHIPVVGVLERWPRILFIAHGYRSQKHHLLWQVRLHVFIGEMGWQKPSPGDMCPPHPQAWGHHRWREGPRWGQHSVPEVGCRLKQLEGDHWGCSVRSFSWCVTIVFVCMYVWCFCVGSAERRTQDSSVRTRHSPSAFLQLYGKRSHTVNITKNRIQTRLSQ